VSHVVHRIAQSLEEARHAVARILLIKVSVMVLNTSGTIHLSIDRANIVLLTIQPLTIIFLHGNSSPIAPVVDAARLVSDP
jgi:hypothetical protein